MLGLDRAASHSPPDLGSLEFLFWFYKHKVSFRVVKWLWKLWIYSTHIDYMLMMGQTIYTHKSIKCNQTYMISMMKKWMPTLVCGVREALESINRIVHNQFKDPQMGNSSTQAIFLDPNGLSLRPFHSPLKVFCLFYLQRKHFSFIALTITCIRLSNSHFYRIGSSHFLWHISRPEMSFMYWM